MDWPMVSLSEVLTIDRNSITPENIASGTRYVGLENMNSDGEFQDIQILGARGSRGSVPQYVVRSGVVMAKKEYQIENENERKNIRSDTIVGHSPHFHELWNCRFNRLTPSSRG